MKNRTTIQLTREFREELKSIKQNKKETYEQLIRRLIKNGTNRPKDNNN